MAAKKRNQGLWRKLSNPIRRVLGKYRLSKKIKRLSMDIRNLREESASTRDYLNKNRRNMKINEIIDLQDKIRSLESQARTKLTEIEKQRKAFKENIESGYIP